MADLMDIKIPFIAETVMEVEVQNWLVDEGSIVKVDQSLVECECIKANFDIPSPAAGKIVKIVKRLGTASIGELIAQLEPADVTAAPAPIPPTPTPTAPEDESWKITGKLPPQEWGRLLREATLARYRATGQWLPVFYWKDGKIVC